MAEGKDVIVKGIYEKAEEIPDVSLKDVFKEKDGKYVATIEGFKTFEEYKATYDQLQNVSSEYQKTKQTLEAFGEETPETFSKAKGRLKELEAIVANAKDPTEIQKKAEEIAQFRTQDLKKVIEQREKELSDFQAKVQQLQSTIRTNEMKSKLSDATKGLINDTAFTDIYLRAQHDGFVYREENGDFYHERSGMNMKEWVQKMLEANPHWQKNSVSGGAYGGNGVGGTSNMSFKDRFIKSWNTK